jgi:hypothetical protein
MPGMVDVNLSDIRLTDVERSLSMGSESVGPIYVGSGVNQICGNSFNFIVLREFSKGIIDGAGEIRGGGRRSKRFAAIIAFRWS